MTPAIACPNDDGLRNFVLGRSTEANAFEVESHLLACPSCLRRLDALRPVDDLVLALRTQKAADTPEPLPERIEALIRRLRPLGGEAQPGSTQPETVALSTQPAEGRGHEPGEPLPETIGRYRIRKLLGAGGMGTVYTAEDPALGRLVAIKVPRREWLGADPDRARARFLREARAAACVRHPHVCTVHDTGEQDGLPYVVLDLIDGASLLEYLRARPPLDPRQAAEWARQLAEALAAVHAAGLTHRDLKPGNVLLTPEGRAVLTDFGLARPDIGEPLTCDGQLVGTPAYMAPEQLAGATVGPWSDLYALGLVLYQMLAGRLPFDGPAPHAASLPPPSRWRPGLDAGLDAIALKALAPRPEDRYSDARALADDLARWLGLTPAPTPEKRPAVVRVELPDGRPVTVQVAEGVPEGGKVQVSVRERPATKKRSRRWAVSVTVTFTLLLAVSLLTLGYFRRNSPHQWAVSEPPTPVAVQGENDPPWPPVHDLTRVHTPRVQLTYEVETGGAAEKIELAFVIGVLADLSGEPQAPRPSLKDRHFRNIDRDNFDDVLRRLAPRVVLRQPSGPAVELTFARMKDFDPDEVAKRVPPVMAARLGETVLARPEYRRLEAAWRGLHFLVQNTATGESLKIRVLDATASELAGDAANAHGLEQTVLYREVYAATMCQLGGQPYALLVGDYEIGPGAADLALLRSVAEVAERAQAPFIAAAAPALLGGERFAELPKLKSLDGDDRLAGWRAFRQVEAAHWAALALPRVVARPGVEGEAEPPWMSAAWVFAAEVADAEAKSGWPARVSAQAGGRVDGLPLWSPGKAAARPTDAALAPAQGYDLARHGFLPLLPLDDKGAAAFVDARSCRAPRPDDAADAEASRISVLLCAARVGHYLAVMSRDKLATVKEVADVEKWLNQWLANYRDEGAAVDSAKQPFAEAAP